ncbi:alpha/beta fold hydrolase [Pseudofrankia asymbiotica]|uniref:AB hydrolase-1 domain-containing protein n=1 Tax=Pseudofrankia asymbiotica TaxID=1834516 RepID=A0A1V2I7D3_9ACTN|nr:alpha/beta hydrolase [Pseudofrankia asymbiotica]ONH27507.1 hypothetical protein BL253_21675 [Pseudofrankia asymbiotica]
MTLESASHESDGGGAASRPPLVVLVHGTRDQASSFDPVAAALDGVDIVSYDRRGWGEKPVWDGTPADLAGHADDLLMVLGDRPATVVGHSWGGNVAVAAAVRRPDLVLSVALWETAMPWASWWKGNHGQLILGAIASVKEKVPGTQRQNRERRLFLAEASATLSRPFDLDHLTARCIAGYGTATQPPFGPGMRAFAELMRADVFELPDANHMAHRENPEGFAQFVRSAIALG